MNFFHFFLFLLMSLMATLPVVFGRRGDSVERQNKLALFQGILGPMGLTFGLFSLIVSGGMSGLVGMIIYSVEVLIGFLLTYGLMSKYVVHRGEIAEANSTRMRLATYQGPLGVLGIALCALWLTQGL
jgi:hypothetical protein